MTKAWKRKSTRKEMEENDGSLLFVVLLVNGELIVYQFLRLCTILNEGLKNLKSGKFTSNAGHSPRKQMSRAVDGEQNSWKTKRLHRLRSMERLARKVENSLTSLELSEGSESTS